MHESLPVDAGSDPSSQLLSIATRNVITLPDSSSLGEATRLMSSRRISSLLIVDAQQHPIGIVTERNVLHAMRTGCTHQQPVREVMSSPLISVPAEMPSQDAYLLCLRKGIRHLVVVDRSGQLVGVVSETDFRLHINLTTLSGRRPVTAMMSRSVLSLLEQESLSQALALMEERKDHCVVVVRDQRPVGIVTERDVVRLYAGEEEKSIPTLAEVMISPVLTVTVDTSIANAAVLMLEQRIRHLVVVDRQGCLAGLVTEHDLTQAMMMDLIDSRLESERSFLRALIDAIPDLVWLKDPNGIYLACNPRFEQFFGASETQIIGRTDYDFVDPQLADFFRDNDRKAMTKDAPSVNEELITFADDGHRELLETVKTPMRDRNGHLIGVLGIGRDITQARQAQEELRRSDERLRLAASVFTNTLEGILITDTSARIVEVNEAFTRITGYHREEVLGENPRMFKSGHQDATFYRNLWEILLESGHWSGEVWNRRKNGAVYAEHLTISAVYDEQGEVTHYVGVFADITPLKEHQRQLERIAHYDALTGVPNRVLLADRMHQAIAQVQREGTMLAVCYLDLDGFKPVNDTFGHQAGDRLLMEMTRRMKGCLRASDTLARIGGDEFVLLLLGLKRLDECQWALRRILDEIALPLEVEEQLVQVSASIGVTLYPVDDVDADALLRHADQAMYKAKESGRGCYHLYDAEQDRRLKADQERMQRLTEALLYNEFVLHYQPKVNITSGEVLGVEALVRWQHPERGLLLPSEFLPAIQGSELEIPFGEWVIENCLKQMVRWQAQGIRLTVSINISAEHLLQQNFAERLRDLLQLHPQVDASCLELEILESTAIADTKQASRTLAECRKLGIQFALDDFGTGYSSLTYFRQLPVETLKIDRSFVLGMLEDPDDLGIVESVVQLTRAFNRSVIAEGVETLEHCAMLSRINCHAAQGYGIARPMPAEEVQHWMGDWQRDEKWLQFATLPDQRQDRDQVLVTAAESHRKWIDSLLAHLHNPEQVTAPPMDTHSCHFGHWYHGSGTIRYGQLKEFIALHPLHEEIHGLAEDLMRLQGQGRRDEVLQGGERLLALRDQMIAGLEHLIEVVSSQ